MEHWHRQDAKRIPDNIRKVILENGWIDTTKNEHVFNGPMEYLFDVYEEFVDIRGEHDDFGCFECRGKVLAGWKTLKPYLEELEKQTV